ncbi:MAG: hypothetical protein GVY19_00365 [Bacteroidetes bacterium]|jgi:glycosyltransferase involved in cell wall biosynthesis|nr:hypothetical protein [Bacteroidota bacterium]
MKKAYIYPRTARTENIIPNPYIDHFIESLKGKVNFLNSEKPSNIGALDIFKFFNKTNIFFFNWIENLPDKKFGVVQSFIFTLIILPMARISNKKIVWTLHNKKPHDNKQSRIKSLLFNIMLKKSDFIITHAKDGVEQVKKLANRKDDEIIYFPHPFSSKIINHSGQKNIDVLIWGTMAPYKGIHNFINLVNENVTLQSKNILMMGKFQDAEYRNKVISMNTSNIEIKDAYIPDNELIDYLSRAKIILFTYHKDSVLSSGALCESLGYGNYIIGPKTGAFKDLEREGLVHTYKSLHEVSTLIEKLCTVENYSDIRMKQQAFIDKYQWEKLPEFIATILN